MSNNGHDDDDDDEKCTRQTTSSMSNYRKQKICMQIMDVEKIAYIIWI